MKFQIIFLGLKEFKFKYDFTRMIVFILICPLTKVIRKEKVKILGVFNLNWITECIITQVDLTIKI